MSIIYTTRGLAKSIAEDAINDRFAKPVNSGEWSGQNGRFYMDKDIDEGLYLLEIDGGGDGVDRTTYISIIKISKNAYSFSSLIDDYDGGKNPIVFNTNEKRELLFDGTFNEEDVDTLIYLYKVA